MLYNDHDDSSAEAGWRNLRRRKEMGAEDLALKRVVMGEIATNGKLVEAKA